ncbi:MAG: AI-2E family transporter [Caldilineaceae bacterium]
MKRVATIAAVILTVITLLIVLWELERIVLLFILSLTIAATVRAPIDALMNRGLSRAVATAIVYFIAVLGLAGLIYTIGSPLANELERAVKDVTTAYSRLQAGWLGGPRLRPLLSNLPTADQFTAFMTGGQDTSSLAQAALTFSSTLVEGVSEVLIAIILSMYWTTDELRFERLWLSLLPSERRARARNAWRVLEAGVGAYIRSELLQSLLAGILLALGFRWLGLHYPVTWALYIALAWLIPLVGALVAIIPLGLVAALNVNPLVALLAILYTLAILIIMEFGVEPRLYTRDRYAKVLVLLVMLAMVDVFGLFGLLIAPIVATAIQIMLNALVATTAPATAPTAQTIDVSALQARLHEVRALVDQTETAASPRIANMTERLDALLKKAEHAEATA